MALFYLEETEGKKQIQPKELKNYIGRKIEYLRDRDIDKSGRGYYFPRTGIIQGMYRNNVLLHDVYEPINTLKEILLIEETKKPLSGT